MGVQERVCATQEDLAAEESCCSVAVVRSRGLAVTPLAAAGHRRHERNSGISTEPWRRRASPCLGVVCITECLNERSYRVMQALMLLTNYVQWTQLVILYYENVKATMRK